MISGSNISGINALSRHAIIFALIWGFTDAVDLEMVAAQEETPQASKIDLATVLQAWTERQNRVRTAHFEWRHDHSGVNRWSSYQAAWPTSARNRGTTRHDSLVVKGNRFRYETDRW